LTDCDILNTQIEFFTKYWYLKKNKKLFNCVDNIFEN